MINKILVPLDGSPLATCTLPHVLALASATGATITLLRVLDNHAAGAEVNPLDWQVARYEAELYLDEIKSKLTPLTAHEPELKVLEGIAADRIVEVLHEEGMDLAVMCSHGSGGMHDWSIGGLAQKVISKAAKSILLVRAANVAEGLTAQVECDEWPTALRYSRILVPLDGSPRSESVLPVACALATAYNAELLLAHIVARPELFQRTPPTQEDLDLCEQIVERNVSEATAYLEQLRARLSPKPTIHVQVEDSVGDALHRIVEQEQCDLTILSAHGHTGHDNLPYGHIVANFISYGRTPLLILQDLPSRQFASAQAIGEDAFPGHGVSGNDEQTTPLHAPAPM